MCPWSGPAMQRDPPRGLTLASSATLSSGLPGARAGDEDGDGARTGAIEASKAGPAASASASLPRSTIRTADLFAVMASAADPEPLRPLTTAAADTATTTATPSTIATTASTATASMAATAPATTSSPSSSGAMARQGGRSVLPDRAVTSATIEDAYVDFILYCNPVVPPDTDTAALREAFRTPPRSGGKSFGIFTLFQLISQLESKEIRTWTELALKLGVEPPDQEKGQSSQKIQQYAVRLKRWMHSMHVDAFFDFLLDHRHPYWVQVPTGPYPVGDQMRDGVAAKDDMALRSLIPEIKPRRGRRRPDEDDDLNPSSLSRPRLELPDGSGGGGGGDDLSSAVSWTAHPDGPNRAFIFPPPPSLGSHIQPHSLPPTPLLHHPSISESLRPLSQQQQQQQLLPPPTGDGAGAEAAARAGLRTPPAGTSWAGNGLVGTPLLAYPRSALTPSTKQSFWLDEPISAVTPTSAKPSRQTGRRHGAKVVSSAWRSSGTGGTGKTRGRPPMHRAGVGGNGPSSGDGHSLYSPYPSMDSSTPTLMTPSELVAAAQNAQAGASASGQRTARPSRLSLQVPERAGGEIRLATPPALPGASAASAAETTMATAAGTAAAAMHAQHMSDVSETEAHMYLADISMYTPAVVPVEANHLQQLQSVSHISPYTIMAPRMGPSNGGAGGRNTAVDAMMAPMDSGAGGGGNSGNVGNLGHMGGMGSFGQAASGSTDGDGSIHTGAAHTDDPALHATAQPVADNNHNASTAGSGAPPPGAFGDTVSLQGMKDNKNVDELQTYFVQEVISAKWVDAQGSPIQPCGVDEAYAIVEALLENMAKSASSKETFLINLSSLTGGRLLISRPDVRVMRLEEGPEYNVYMVSWELHFGDIRGQFFMREQLAHSRWRRLSTATKAAFERVWGRDEVGGATGASGLGAGSGAGSGAGPGASGVAYASSVASSDLAGPATTTTGDGESSDAVLAELWEKRYTRLLGLLEQKDLQLARLRASILQSLR